jgi:hypothetical protein
MRNVFLLYMPPGNVQAMVHYEETINQRVELDRIAKFVSSDLAAQLQRIFRGHRVAVWGSEPGPRNQNSFDRMSPGDHVLIVEGESIRLIGQVAAKTVNPKLSHDLWKTLRDGAPTAWSLIYFIANAREVNVRFAKFCELFGYQANFRLRGFTAVAEAKLGAFYEKYDDLYSVLVRLETGQPVLEKVGGDPSDTLRPEPLVELKADDVDTVLREELISDHVRMQFKLARLGIKAGEKVWVPVGDQTRLRKSFQFDSFDKEFSSGIDLPHSYVENIDVVWKQEFRIAAAYEIENSTSIYSGLLRFSDLMILAPNTLYPMFVVAPAARKNQLREQLRRPTFKRMDLCSKVRFLSYEEIDKVDSFFEGRKAGLTVDVLAGRSELVCEELG